jgi:hypothetical protein
MRLRHHIHHPKRAGLTLVEMLIALALSIFIMAILSEAFVKGLEVFGQYKALADLEQRLRTVANIVRRDLRAQHFDGGRKLSECTASGKPMPMLDGLRAAPYTAIEAQILLRQLEQYKFKSPGEGFFSVEEWPNRPAPFGATTFFEGIDASGRPSYRDRPAFAASPPAAPGTLSSLSDVLHFTSKLEGNEPDKFYYGRNVSLDATGLPIPGRLDGAGNFLSRYDGTGGNQLYTSQAAELLYFLHTDDSAFLPGVDSPNGPVLTFNLYRQAYLLIPSHFKYNPSLPIPTILTGDPTFNNNVDFRRLNDVSGHFDATPTNPNMPAGGIYFNTMADVQHQANRVNPNGIRSPRDLGAPGFLREGSDILLTNVISFNVQVFDPFAYKIPVGLPGGGFGSGRGAYVDIGDVLTAPGINIAPTAAGAAGDFLQPVYGGPVDTLPFINPITNQPVVTTFDTGTSRFEGTPGGATLSPAASPSTHLFPFPSIQITIRVYEPKSRQTRQITIIQDM